MKTILAVTSVAGAAVLLAHGINPGVVKPGDEVPGAGPERIPPPAQNGTVARYLLTEGHENVSGQAYPRTFRIDSFTGETWVLREQTMAEGNTPPRHASAWEPVPEAGIIPEKKNAEIEGGPVPPAPVPGPK